MEFETILKNLKKKVYHPIYLLQGEEPYFIDQISNYIEKNVLSDAEKGFNQTIFYGRDTDETTIIHSALRFPMMSDKQVIIVKEAQNLKKIDELLSYATKPMASTILVLNYKYKTIAKNTKLVKAINQSGVVFTASKLREYQISGWVEKQLKRHGYTIDPQACQILTDSLGTDLSKIANEMNKLVIAVKDTNHITADHIEKNIGISKDYNLFELQDALTQRNVLKANQIINYFGANSQQHPIQMTIAVLFGYYSKLFAIHFLNEKSEQGVAGKMKTSSFYAKKLITASKKYNPTKLYEIIGILREYDLKSKGMGVSTMVETAELQKEMIYKILHP
ncbi:MAG TPA: DNA polymerase III subunit delta [Mariniphaga sp.]|nr:DNA polymerase III subunit delta [Mariniphaga sp.]